MKIAIRYFSKSKKGNTKKLADAAGEALNLDVLTIDKPLEEEVDILFLPNAMYAFDIDKKVKEFLENNKDKIKRLINICSSASGKSTHKSIKKVTDKLGINLDEKEFSCQGSWIFINKGKPNEDDLNRLKEFVKEIASPKE